MCNIFENINIFQWNTKYISNTSSRNVNIFDDLSLSRSFFSLIVTSRVFKITDLYDINTVICYFLFFFFSFKLILFSIHFLFSFLQTTFKMKLVFFIITLIIYQHFIKQISIDGRPTEVKKFSWAFPIHDDYQYDTAQQLVKRKGAGRFD